MSTDYVVPDVRRAMFGGTTTDYDRWDRFGRPLTNQWEDYGASTTADQVDYEYDYAGNRTSRFVTASTNDTRDQVYSYDGLHRLQSMDQGTESSGSITSKNFEQDFTLDQLGNWENLTETNGTSTTLNQNRTFNAANELETITTWSNPNYDAAGNAVSIPDPNAPASSLTLKYDAWNRLVEVKRGSTVVQTNRYDGLGRRVMRDETGGGGEKRWFFYNEKWQVIEERVSNQNYWNAPADAQYVYHPQYVDTVAMRYWDSDATGGADKEHYYLQDSNFNVTAIVENDGTVAERYAYSPYGKVTVLDPNFAVDADGKSDIDNEYLFTGRRLDPVTGLQINRNRFYASHLGRWVNRDPIGYRGGTNLYGYVGGMPAHYLDPLGLILIDPPPIWIPRPLPHHNLLYPPAIIDIGPIDISLPSLPPLPPQKDNDCPDELLEEVSQVSGTVSDVLETYDNISTIGEGIQDIFNGSPPLDVLDGVGTIVTGWGTAGITEVLSALEQFEPTQPCGEWYKNAIESSVRAISSCSPNRCNSIHTADDGPGLFVACKDDIRRNQQSIIGIGVAEQFDKLAKALESKCRAAATSPPCVPVGGGGGGGGTPR